ncbi:MAG: hypothetical protein GY820_05860, partial [Gammaproteobacteria bacterium]|nr:hypothetical protein [Gammaproteobacteria bacterium]
AKLEGLTKVWSLLANGVYTAWFEENVRAICSQTGTLTQSGESISPTMAGNSDSDRFDQLAVLINSNGADLKKDISAYISALKHFPLYFVFCYVRVWFVCLFVFQARPLTRDGVLSVCVVSDSVYAL